MNLNNSLPYLLCLLNQLFLLYLHCIHFVIKIQWCLRCDD